ncbi:helix-turn-helix transcriptional regulator [Mucilaginibacter sp.]|uniref:ArsR/SmtB family transcription factor n=1 Tax=Mucilaginibacter sp. TaxID=1882438 RepID=UPI00262B0A74|nr:metalloregulator ArsR/SmtB family transcription factor [Mucilaginibacter sp.]MDB4924958.1 transcriptional regulator, ArsR family [Mucilaginibacter sp.]
MILDIKKVERISKALGDPYRLKIMEMIKKQNDNWMQCACIADNIDLAQSTISHHINQLVDADLLIAEKDGRNAKYLVNKEVVTAYVNFLNQLKG